MDKSYDSLKKKALKGRFKDVTEFHYNGENFILYEQNVDSDLGRKLPSLARRIEFKIQTGRILKEYCF